MILGGTHQYKNSDERVCENDDKFIMQGCQKIVPGLKDVPLLNKWVGLRPGRSSIRLETDVMSNGKRAQLPLLLAF